MRYRRLTEDGDYSFGGNANDFLSDIYAVAQAIQTRLQLLKESFWRDTTDGLPLFQSILGTPGSPNNIESVTNLILQRVKDTPGVSFITASGVTWDATARSYSYTLTVQTIYSQTVITGTIA